MNSFFVKTNDELRQDQAIKTVRTIEN